MMFLFVKEGECNMPIVAQIILGLLVLIVIYYVVRRIVNSPHTHKHAKSQHEKFNNGYEVEEK
jgi:sorbitol-specific phosphotransferase system component IIC